MKKIIIILACLIVGCIFVQRQQYKKINSLNKSIQPTIDSIKKLNFVIDSLNSEVFQKDVSLQRYELIFDRAQAEMSPDCKLELQTIISNTE
jgi:hypothetical protein